MKYSLTHMDEISIRKHKGEVSYTNSFPFRARCKACGDLPDSRIYRASMYYAWESPQEYHKQKMNSGAIRTRMKVAGKHDIKKTHVPIHSMKIVFFSKEPGRFMRRECWPRIVFCKCRSTHWTFNNVTDLHSTKMVSLKKR